ncbi:helix-turn-helix domain-containing protein [Pseudomonas aeruginosa]|nr:helix-turn-helix domain-containing protein [Pseudomonas aeruginosa]
MRYHLSWKHRDIDAVMALYHPEVEYNDFFQNRRMRLADLREYVEATMPKGPDESLEHTDRIRFDGDTAFIQYRLRVTLSGRLASFRASEAITVRDGLIWRINEYASLVHESGGGAQAPYLDPDLDLTQVANATGYTRNQISYLLNQVLGLSFYQYVNQTRLQHLLGQLSGELPGRVDELAFAAGFNSLSAFYRCFRQHTGQSPREYLKRLSSRR